MANATAATLAKLAAQCLQLAADLEAQESNPAPTGEAPDTVSAKEAFERWGMGKAALIARGIPCARYGRAYRWKVSDILAALEVQPPKPRPPKKVECDGDELDALIASGAVRR